MLSNRLSSGNKSLDAQIEKGYPSSSVIAYVGPPGTGKTSFGLQFIDEGVKQNEKTMILTTNHSIQDLRKYAEMIDLNLQNVIIIDACNWRIKRIDRSIVSESKYEITNIADLNSLLAMIVQVVKENGPITRFLFDTPSNLLLYSTPSVEQILKFFELLISFTRNNGITMLYTIEERVHTDSIISTFLFLSDGAIKFQISDNLKTKANPIFLHFTNLKTLD